MTNIKNDTQTNGAGGFHLVFSAFNGADLLAGLGQLEHLPHLCILDLHMPVMDGIESAKRLRECYPSIILFGYTASENPREVGSMLENGVRKVYSKSIPNKCSGISDIRWIYESVGNLKQQFWQMVRTIYS